MKYFFILLISLFVTYTLQAQIKDSVEVYFETNEYELSPNNKQSYIQVLKGKITSANKLLIYGYTDKMGVAKSNNHLAHKRAETVKILILATLPNAQIRLVQGRGEDHRASAMQPDQKGRRVVVYILHSKEIPAKADVVDIPALGPAIDITQKNEYGAIDLPDLNFYPNTIYLVEESLPRLQDILATLKLYDFKFELQGHICCDFETGHIPNSIAYELSIHRAYTIYKIFVDGGINPNRMSYKGFGTTRPLYKGNDIDSMSVNRRVSIKILD